MEPLEVFCGCNTVVGVVVMEVQLLLGQKTTQYVL